MNKLTRSLIEAARAAIHQLDGVYEGRAAVATLEAALKPFDRADGVKLAWSYDGNTYSCEIVGHRYTVSANGNEPASSSIRWIAACDNDWLSDGEPRCRDAKALCVRHAQNAARAKNGARS